MTQASPGTGGKPVGDARAPGITVAAVDVGSNTVRLLIAKVTASGLRRLDRRSVVTRLAEGVDRTGRLHPEAVGRTLDVLATYAGLVAASGCDRVGVIATSAVRDATNRAIFTEPARATMGVPARVLSGEEEAAMAFAGTIGAGVGRPPLLVIDVGGGSTEFVAGSRAVEWAVSVDIGSVRLTERLLPDRPASAAAVAVAYRQVAGLFAAQVQVPHPVGTVVGVGGTFTALAAIHRRLPVHDPQRVHGTVVSAADLEALVQRLASLDLAATRAIPSLDPARAPVLLAGAVVAHAAVRHVGAASVTASEHDILDGLALALVGTVASARPPLA